MMGAGITGALAAAGVPSGAVHWWFARPRAALGGFSPCMFLATGGDQKIVLALARIDARELSEELAPT